MKAIVYTEYGPPDVLQLREVEKPAPKDDEVLIRVCATTAAAAEMLMRKGEPLWGRLILGLRGPRKKMQTLGIELAGEIESVGKDVKRFKKWDRVYGFASGFPVGSSSGQSSRRTPGTVGQASPQPIVISMYASTASACVSFCGVDSDRSIPTWCITSRTSG